MSFRKVIILGHRGEGCTNRDPAVFKRNLAPRNDPFFEGQILPENSLSAFESALKHGADGIECDVYASKDKIPMVVHDNQLARNIDGHHQWGKEQDDECLGLVSDFTAAELKEKFTIGNGEYIPTLDEVIELMWKYNKSYQEKNGRNYTINIELKGDPAIAGITHKVLEKYIQNPACPFEEKDFLFNSFDAPCVEAMIQINPRMRCALAFASKDIFQCPVRLPGWVPEVKVYPASTIPNFSATVDTMKLSGLDVVTSDVMESLPALCAQKGIFFSASTNAVRLRCEAELYGMPEARWTDLEREKKEFRKIAYFSKKFDLLVNYRADNPGYMKSYLQKLEKIETVTADEKEKTKACLQRNRLKYDPGLFASLQARMQDYQADTRDEMGQALAKVYEEALDEVVVHLNTRSRTL